MSFTSSLVRAAAVAAIVAGAGSAHAALTSYTSSTTFAAAAGSTVVDSFDDLVADFAASPLTRAASGLGYTATANAGFFGAGSGSDQWLSTNFAGTTITFDGFTSAVNAIGGQFFGSDALGAFIGGQTLTVTALDSLGAVAQLTLNNATLSSFAGFTSTGTIVSLTVAIDGIENWATANNLTLAPVPEAGTMAMLFAGLGVVGFVARRRRSA